MPITTRDYSQITKNPALLTLLAELEADGYQFEGQTENDLGLETVYACLDRLYWTDDFVRISACREPEPARG